MPPAEPAMLRFVHLLNSFRVRDHRPLSLLVPPKFRINIGSHHLKRSSQQDFLLSKQNSVINWIGFQIPKVIKINTHGGMVPSSGTSENLDCLKKAMRTWLINYQKQTLVPQIAQGQNVHFRNGAASSVCAGLHKSAKIAPSVRFSFNIETSYQNRLDTPCCAKTSRLFLQMLEFRLRNQP